MLVSERYIFIKLTLEGICIVLLYAFPSRAIFLWFIQKFDDFCYLLPGVEVGKLAGVARTEALLELGTPVDPSHQPVERYPGGSGGKVEHGELCLPVTSVFYHNLFFFE